MSLRRFLDRVVRLAAFPCIIVGEEKYRIFSKEKGAKNGQNWPNFEVGIFKLFMSPGNPACLENPLGVIFMKKGRPDNELMF